MKKINLIFLSLLITLCSCQKNSRNNAPPPPPIQPSPAPQKHESEKDNPDIYKQEFERAQLQVEAEKNALETEKNKAQATLNLLAASEGPRSALIAALNAGSSKPVLFIVYGTSISKLRLLENEISATRSAARPTIYSHIESLHADTSQSQVYGEFLVNVDSADKFKILLDYSRRLAPEVKMLFFPAQDIIVRNYVEFDYKGANPFSSEPIVKKIWIGDSGKAQVNFLPIAFGDLETALPYISSCEKFDAGCLRSLIAQGFFADHAETDTAVTGSLDFFRKNLRQAVTQARQRGLGSIKTYFGDSAQDIRLTNEIWVVYPDSSDLLDLSLLRNIAEKAERYSDSAAIYETPVVFHSGLPKYTNDSQLNFNVGVTQLYEYLCKVTTCLSRD